MNIKERVIMGLCSGLIIGVAANIALASYHSNLASSVAPKNADDYLQDAKDEAAYDEYEKKRIDDIKQTLASMNIETTPDDS